MKNRHFILAAAMGLSSLGATAQTKVDLGQLTIKGQIKPRAELYNGINGPVNGGPALGAGNNTPGLAIQQRSRLTFNYKKDKLTIQISPQYVNFWGAEAQTHSLVADQGPNTSFSLFEGWAQYQFTEKSAVKFGRQPLVYGDQRILGGLDWAAAGRAHDALVYKFKSGSTSFDIGATYNDTQHNNDVNQFAGTAG
ncbi:MAG: hypothetical protein AB8B61_10175, partial [Cyclobacteriaceae bacterium]